jgi:membrane-bound lytic murein transglycosylase D
MKSLVLSIIYAIMLVFLGCGARVAVQTPIGGDKPDPPAQVSDPGQITGEQRPAEERNVAGVTNTAIDSLVSASEGIYNQAVLEYEQGNLSGSDSLFQDALNVLIEAKLWATKYPSTYNAFKKVMDRMYADLNESLQQLDSPSEDILSASKEELEKAKVDSQSVAEHKNGFDLPIDPSQPLVQKYLKLFQEGKRRAFIEESFRRSGRYRDMVLREIRARGLPEELWLVALIESGYKTSAYSRKRAAGLWQFIPSTARNYGLIINEWLDERRDPEKSTRAALTYLEDLYKWFNSWDWALAAYNRGETNIHNDIKNSHIVDFYTIAEAGATHPQTRNHVPQIHAAAIIAKDPSAYGFNFQYDPPLQVDTVKIDYVVDLGVVAHCVGTEEKEVRELNPELRTWVTPLLSEDYPSYVLKLPVGTRERYLSNIKNVKELTPERRIRYIVKRGDTLGRIAHRFGVDWRQVRRWNNIRGTTIYPGQSLIIRADHRGGSSSGHLVMNFYVVRRGDTLSGIAKKHGVRISDIRRWNGLGKSRFIYPGQRLRIYLPKG